MDYKNMTAPCGIPCFECISFKAKSNDTIKKALSERSGLPYDKSDCEGCRNRNGKAFLFEKNNIFPEGKCFLFANENGQCKIYLCNEKKQIHNCSECNNFPCELLQPLADKANIIPQNLKVFNLALIKKIGLEKWAIEKAGKVWAKYLKEEFGS